MDAYYIDQDTKNAIETLKEGWQDVWTHYVPLGICHSNECWGLHSTDNEYVYRTWANYGIQLVRWRQGWKARDICVTIRGFWLSIGFCWGHTLLTAGKCVSMHAVGCRQGFHKLSRKNVNQDPGVAKLLTHVRWWLSVFWRCHMEAKCGKLGSPEHAAHHSQIHPSVWTKQHLQPAWPWPAYNPKNMAVIWVWGHLCNRDLCHSNFAGFIYWHW